MTDRRVIIARHGKAHAQSDSGLDEDRELRPRGERQARFLGETLAEVEWAPVRIVASPIERAITTARLANETLGVDLDIDDRLRHWHPASDALAVLLEAVDDAPSILVVGHNPQLEALTGLLLGGLGASGVRLRTGEAHVVDFDPEDPPGSGRLHDSLRLND